MTAPTTPLEALFEQYPEALERLLERVNADLSAFFTEEQRTDLELGGQHLGFDLADDGVLAVRVYFDVGGKPTPLLNYDAATIGLHLVDDAWVYIPR